MSGVRTMHTAEMQEATLLDLLDRLLAGGVVIHGDITLAVADVDLVHVGLRAVVAAVDSLEPAPVRTGIET